MILIDKIILGFIAIGAVMGLFRGFFREIVGTIGVLVAVLAANIISPQVRHWAALVVSGDQAVAIVAWLVVFILIMVALALISHLLEKLFGACQMGWLVRLAGALFGAVKFLLIAAVLILFIEFCIEHLSLAEGTPEWMRNSVIIPHIHQLVHTLYYSTFN